MRYSTQTATSVRFGLNADTSSLDPLIPLEERNEKSVVTTVTTLLFSEYFPFDSTQGGSYADPPPPFRQRFNVIKVLGVGDGSTNAIPKNGTHLRHKLLTFDASLEHALVIPAENVAVGLLIHYAVEHELTVFTAKKDDVPYRGAIRGTQLHGILAHSQKGLHAVPLGIKGENAAAFYCLFYQGQHLCYR